MSFTSPTFLWTLLLIPLTLAALLAIARRRRHATRRFADDRLLPSVAVRPTVGAVRWTTALQLAALAALLLAAARPVAAPPWPANRASVVIALDASRSMLADDLTPSRLEAARALVAGFVRQAPASTRIGLVSFSNSAAPLVLPTTDRAQVLAALADVQPASNTSLTAAVVSGVRALPGRERAPIPDPLLPSGSVPQDAASAAPTPAADLPPARLLILSDGVDNVGVSAGVPRDLRLELAARFASDQEVAIYTVPIGREGGTVSTIDGQPYFVPFDAAPLVHLSEASGGRTLDPEDADAQARMFRELGTDVRWEPTELEVSAPLAGLAVLLLLLAGALSLQWQRRVP